MFDNYNKNDETLMRNLAKLLNFALPSKIILLGFFVILTVYAAMILVTVAAVITMVYILYVLMKIRREKWIYTYGIIVGIPLLLILGGIIFSSFLAALLFIPVIFHYFYCFLLRFSVNEWLKELREKAIYEERKRIREEELKEYLQIFEREI